MVTCGAAGFLCLEIQMVCLFKLGIFKGIYVAQHGQMDSSLKEQTCFSWSLAVIYSCLELWCDCYLSNLLLSLNIHLFFTFWNSEDTTLRVNMQLFIIEPNWDLFAAISADLMQWAQTSKSNTNLSQGNAEVSQGPRINTLSNYDEMH